MCTIITLFQVHPAFPLVIAANRDERYARVSSGPTVLGEPAAVVAGRDGDFGGTWFGVNAHGVAVAVADQGLGQGTAQPTRRGDPTRRSRGLLVLDTLACPSVAAASALLAAVPLADYNPFTVLHADVKSAAIAHHADGPVTLRALAPGLDVMVSAIGADHARWRTEYVLGALNSAELATMAPDALRNALQGVLRHHAPPGGQDDAICRHRGDAGTVSSFIALLGPDLPASQLHCALGPPCRTPYADDSHLLHALAAAHV